MNAFLFNCALILVVSVTVIQFAAQSFEPIGQQRRWLVDSKSY